MFNVIYIRKSHDYVYGALVYKYWPAIEKTVDGAMLGMSLKSFNQAENK